jgi:hypothetical protein
MDVERLIDGSIAKPLWVMPNSPAQRKYEAIFAL